MELKISKELVPKLLFFESFTLLYFVQYTYLFGGKKGILLSILCFLSIFYGLYLDFKSSNESISSNPLIKYLAILFVIIYIVSKSAEVLFLLILIYGFRNASIKDIRAVLLIDFFVKLFFILLAFSFSQSGIILNRIVKNTYQSFGFSHVNRFGGILFVLSLQLWMIYKTDNKVKCFTALVLISEYLINCRTSFLLSMILLIMEIVYSYLLRLKNKNIEIYDRVLAFLIFAPVMLSYYFAFFYNASNGIERHLNKLLSFRLDLSHQATEQLKLTLFGQQLVFVPSDQISNTSSYFAIDNYYIYILYGFGIIFTLIFLAALIYFTIQIYKEKNSLLLSCLALSSMFCFMENQMLSISLNITVLYFGCVCFKKDIYMENMKTIAFEPYENKENKYIEIMQNCIDSLGYKIIPLSRVFEKSCKVVFLNWYEDTPYKNNKFKSLISFIKRVIKIILLRLLNKKIIYVFHNKQSHDQNSTSRLLQKFLINQSNIIIIHSKSSEKYIDEKYKKKLFYIPHPNYIGDYKKSKKELIDNIDCNKPIFLFIGAVKPYKNIELLIDTARLFPEIQFIIAGKPANDKYKAELQRLIKNYSNITAMFKFIVDDEIVSLISASDLLVLPYDVKSSLNSGTIFLAFSNKRTVISPRIATLEDLKNENFYFYYDYESNEEHKIKLENEIRKALEVFKLDKTELKKMGVDAYNYVKTNNSKSKIIERYKDLFKRLEI